MACGADGGLVCVCVAAVAGAAADAAWEAGVHLWWKVGLARDEVGVVVVSSVVAVLGIVESVDMM